MRNFNDKDLLYTYSASVFTPRHAPYDRLMKTQYILAVSALLPTLLTAQSATPTARNLAPLQATPFTALHLAA